MTWWYTVLTSGWVISLILVPVLARRYSPAKALGWLAVMFAVPWVGLVLFLMFAANPWNRRRIVRYRLALDGSTAADRFAQIEGSLPKAPLAPWLEPIAQAAEACGALPPNGGNAVEFSAEHEQTLEWLLRDIDAARDHVHMVFYIIGNDDVGRRVAEALARAAARGVACRVVADALGSRSFLKRIAPGLNRKGVRVTAAMRFNPLKGQLARLDVRNHRKIAVIDGRVGYIGSWNIVNPGFRPAAKGLYRDLMARVQGPAALHLQLLFLEDWTLEAGESLASNLHDRARPGAEPPRLSDVLVTPENAGDIVAQLLPSGPLYPFPPVRDQIVELLGLARRRVILTTPYFIPDEAVMLSLRLAAQRGVEVNMIVPTHSDSRLAAAAGRAYSAELVEAKVHVYCYNVGFLHAKTLTVDDEIGMVGSANFDVRSFGLDIEANLILYTATAVKALREIQDQYMAGSVPFLEQWKGRNWLRRAADDTAKLVSPLA
jgi:cardiolipin synthase